MAITRNRLSLLPHNAEAARKVLDAFSKTNRAAVVHSTGTGKSYIIAEVAGRFNHPLIIAPNNFVLNETKKICRSGTEFQTYSSQLRKDDFIPDRYDLIVLDEFHRAGAKEWGKSVEKLLAANPNAKILGTSATHIRYLDGERNMGDELFDGNVVSYLPLHEAISRGILPNPTYVYSAYTLSEDAAIRRAKILSSSYSEEWKRERLRQLKKITNNWENADGVSRIIRKYIPHDTQRIIVFCPNTKKASQARGWLSKWFESAGYKNLLFYNIDYKESRLDKEMQKFCDPCGKGQIKIAISVNMLNEGIHIPRVDAVMMLRSTISRIILEQQTGRCLTADNRERIPVVLDLVNNIDSIRYDFRHIIGGDSTTDKDKPAKEKFAFNVIDESGDIRDFFLQLDNELSLRKRRTLEECIEEAKKYKTRAAFKKGSSEYYRCTINHGWSDIVMAHMPKPKRWTLEEALKDARKYKNPQALMDANYGLYRTIHERKGWKKKCFAHMTYLQQQWTKEKVLAIALKYDSRKKFREANPAAYNWVAQRKLQDEIYAHMTTTRKTWNDDSVRAAALECRTKQEFADRYPGAYNYAYKKRFIGSVCSHMDKVSHRTLEECRKTALKYKTRKELMEAEPNVYGCIIRHDWKKECFAHMSHVSEPLNYTLEECLDEARKYKTRYEFSIKSARHYRTIKKNHWEKEYYKTLPSKNESREKKHERIQR